MGNWSIAPYVHETVQLETFYSDGVLWETSPEGEAEMLPEGWYYRFITDTSSESFGPFKDENEALADAQAEGEERGYLHPPERY